MARKGKMITKEIASVYLQETMQVKVFLPETFNPLYQTTICYMQDGNDYFQMGRVATVSDRLHEEEVLVNTTFVGIHYIDRRDRLRKYYPYGEQYKAYQQFLMEEVLPVVEDVHPINPLGKKQALMGDSLAGTFALVMAMKYPKTFHSVIMQSPLVDDVIMELVLQSKTHVQRLSIYHSIGRQESKVWTTLKEEVDFIAPNRQLAVFLSENCSDYHFEEIADGNHTWKYWQKELPEVLEKMFM